MRARITSSKRGGALPGVLAAVDSRWEDAVMVIATAGKQAARFDGGFGRRDGRELLIRVGLF